ncbi:MAG: F0F1 ATP synthase subunit epsilon, partial [Planctomycetes bacterium]|nr:F0F1 ATP synthase subunit epsilon [Planctomycetota bacterium]
MTKTFRCSIVTPSESVFDGEVAYVSYQAWDGQQGIMVEQSPILAKLGIGSLRLDLTEGGTRWYLLDGGFSQVGDGILTLLTENAFAADSI